ncbi:Pectinesterase inhibitor domain containing protein [Parasponia andersonii]|uniref:Pectinesterase inhibitor domain containing protein n=1 Tax=Parasponia andersonii TaxID=3476 RepID=A0A2P5BV22_PARAD|nr:Pectinesterase inhibitor domain containing protein [Parasponia andersonii]
MDSPNLKFSTLLSILFLLFLSSPPSTKAESQLVDTICQETLNYTMCLEALGSDPQAKTTTDLKVLAKITLRLSISNAKDSLRFINKMINNINEITDDQPIVALAALKQCAYWYEAVIGSFKSALVELKEDIMTANYDIKVAADDADYCQNELVSKKVDVPSLSERNYQVKLYSSIGFVITNKLP